VLVSRMAKYVGEYLVDVISSYHKEKEEGG
jgi:hypothetical protein